MSSAANNPVTKTQNSMKDKTIQNEEATGHLLTRAEVARYFKVTKETIRRWENRGLITPIIINARVYRYSLSSINNLGIQSIKDTLRTALPSLFATQSVERTIVRTVQLPPATPTTSSSMMPSSSRPVAIANSTTPQRVSYRIVSPDAWLCPLTHVSSSGKVAPPTASAPIN